MIASRFRSAPWPGLLGMAVLVPGSLAGATPSAPTPAQPATPPPASARSAPGPTPEPLHAWANLQTPAQLQAWVQLHIAAQQAAIAALLAHHAAPTVENTLVPFDRAQAELNLASSETGLLYSV